MLLFWRCELDVGVGSAMGLLWVSIRCSSLDLGVFRYRVTCIVCYELNDKLNWYLGFSSVDLDRADRWFDVMGLWLCL